MNEEAREIFTFEYLVSITKLYLIITLNLYLTLIKYA